MRPGEKQWFAGGPESGILHLNVPGRPVWDIQMRNSVTQIGKAAKKV
jgi:hypothetical protein